MKLHNSKIYDFAPTAMGMLAATALIGIAILCGASISPWWMLAPFAFPVVLVATIFGLTAALIIAAIITVVALIILVVAIGLVFLVPLIVLVLLCKLGSWLFGF